MARLILSEAEKKSATYLQWDDESLGRAVKKLSLGIVNHHGDKAVAYTACAVMLACMAADRDANTIVELSGVRDGEKQVGDWRIVITRSATKTTGASKVVGYIDRGTKKKAIKQTAD